jgi:hypothetical protein
MRTKRRGESLVLSGRWRPFGSASIWRMLTHESDEGVQAAIAGELRLHEDPVRRTREETEALLHFEFFEFGASGRRWNRRDMIEAMAQPKAQELRERLREVLAGTRP